MPQKVEASGPVNNPVTIEQKSFAPPKDQRLLFIGQDVASIRAYVKSTGNVPAGWMTYTSIQQLHGLNDAVEYGAGVQHAAALLKTHPKTALQVGLWMVGALEGVAQGEYDGNINRLADWLNQLDCPVYLRIGYEFDLPDNHYEPALYVRAFRHLVDRLRSRGVANTAFVWHSYASTLSQPLTAWYPGDDYVDWCAVSLFDQDYEQLIPMAEFAKAHNKPLMIGEATPRGVGTVDFVLWWQWWEACDKYMKQYGVQALSYINTDWESHPMFKGQGWGDSRLEANVKVASFWLEETTREKYLHASPELYASVNFKPGPARRSRVSSTLRSLLPYKWR